MKRTRNPSVSVVIPARNEARNLEFVLGELPDVHEVILVDGYSVDDTVAVARRVRPDIRTLDQTRIGKGNALACGFAEATGDVIVMLDADGSADPAEMARFVEVLVDGADFAKGTRFCRDGGSDDITALRRLGNALLNGLTNVLFDTHFTDLCYGYNAFWRDVVPLLGLPALHLPVPAGEMVWGDGFEVETLINCRAAAAGLCITEVPSVERLRRYGDSHLNAVSDGMRVLRTILAERRRATSRRAGVPMWKTGATVATALPLMSRLPVESPGDEEGLTSAGAT
jgi:glycosyltransferase involved in cell wall biosynthesis